jgi:hypothetical protein
LIHAIHDLFEKPADLVIAVTVQQWSEFKQQNVLPVVTEIESLQITKGPHE